MEARETAVIWAGHKSTSQSVKDDGQLLSISQGSSGPHIRSVFSQQNTGWNQTLQKKKPLCPSSPSSNVPPPPPAPTDKRVKSAAWETNQFSCREIILSPCISVIGWFRWILNGRGFNFHTLSKKASAGFAWLTMLRPQRHAWRGVRVCASTCAGTALWICRYGQRSVLENVSSYLS